MAYCPRCGVTVAPSDLRCVNCGLGRPEGPTGTTTQPLRQPPFASPPRRGSHPAALLVALVAVVVMLAVAAAAAAALWATGIGPFGPADPRAVGEVSATGTDSADPTPPVSTGPSSSLPTSDPATTTGPRDFADVYSSVESGVGLVSVDTCDAAFTGTGFLVRPDTVVTAAHVVDGATGVSVEFDGEPVKATVVGVDPALDVAVLSLATADPDRHVFALAVADPDTGTHVAVIGYPFDEPKSLTEGTISGSGRTITTESGTFTGLLQTDAAINPGNSGGPLLNDAGEVVGVADAIRTHAQGIGFAVPMSRARGEIDSGAGLIEPQAPSCRQPTTGTDDAAGGIRQTLSSYLAAINAGDYDAAMSLVSPSIRADASPAQWHSDYATTYDDQLELHSLSVSSATATVWATFRSRQAPGYGPPGAADATCLVWSVEYTMAEAGSAWIIDSAKSHQTPAWTRCD